MNHFVVRQYPTQIVYETMADIVHAMVDHNSEVKEKLSPDLKFKNLYKHIGRGHRFSFAEKDKYVELNYIKYITEKLNEFENLYAIDVLDDIVVQHAFFMHEAKDKETIIMLFNMYTCIASHLTEI